MQPSILEKPTDTDDITRAAEEVAERKAELSRKLRKASQAGQQGLAKLGEERNPALVIGLAIAAVAVAGVALALARRRRSSNWLRPARPTAVGTAARGVGVFLLRMAAREIAGRLVTKLDTSEGAPMAFHDSGPSLASSR